MLENGISDELFGLGVSTLWRLEASYQMPMLYVDEELTLSFRVMGICQAMSVAQKEIEKAHQMDTKRFRNWEMEGYEMLSAEVWRQHTDEYVVE
jgi:hypothetical protein